MGVSFIALIAVGVLVLVAIFVVAIIVAASSRGRDDERS
jgi:hypothetical protein